MNIHLKRFAPVLWIAVGIVLGKLIFGSGSETPPRADHQHEASEYTCSMHPQIRQPNPGKCPLCGMDLTPVASSENGTSTADRIKLSDAELADSGIRTTPVRLGKTSMRIPVNGTVLPAENSQYVVTSRFSGRVESMFVNVTGSKVEKGQVVAEIFSPEVIAAQRELLEVLPLAETNPALLASARRRLELWNIPSQEIEALISRKTVKEVLPVVAPASGTVTEIMARDGASVEAGMPLLKLVDLNRVWVQFDVFEKDVPFVQVGDSLYFSPASNPSLQRKSKIEFVDPLLNLETRTLGARTSVQGGAGWQPGMIVQGTIVTRPISGIEIPASALLWAGATSYVWIKAYDGSFEIREVRTGMRTQNGWLVARGLNGGEEIVVQGVFRLDAAAQLSGKLSMLNRPAEKAETGAWSEQAWMKRVLDVQTIAGDKKASLPVTPEVLSSLTKHYLELTDALVASDFKTAKSISEKLTELIVRQKDNGGDKSLSAVREQVQKIRSSSSITGMRQQLNIFSMHLAEWLEAAPKIGDSLYLQYCPMARNDVGGFWISRTREIRNPYFGNSMLECGETISKIQ